MKKEFKTFSSWFRAQFGKEGREARAIEYDIAQVRRKLSMLESELEREKSLETARRAAHYAWCARK